MRRFLVVLVVTLLGTLLCSCRNSSLEETVSSDIAKNDNRYKYGTFFDEASGWCWEFLYCDYNETNRNTDPAVRIYHFWGTNLRFRYAEDYWNWKYEETPTGYIKNGIKTGIMQWGSASDAQARDMSLMRTILSSDKTVQDLLAVEEKEYSFETIDGRMVFQLVHSTLEGPYTDELSFSSRYNKENYPKSALLSLIEPDYRDGYKFQCIYVSQCGIIGNTYIDVLYKTGEEYDEYIQLSDLVEVGNATQEQKEAFALIQTIRSSILDGNSFIASAENYREKSIGEIDFSRLYDFLAIIHESKWGDSYLSTMIDPCPSITVEISKEEWERHQGQNK